MRAGTAIRQTETKAQADWAARHPALAAEEAALATAQRKAERDFGHKVHGTTETHARAARTRQGAIARLYERGHLSIDQLGAALELAAAAAAIATGLSIRTMSLETRVDTSPRAGGQFYEALGAVRREVTFGRWKAAMLAGPGAGRGDRRYRAAHRGDPGPDARCHGAAAAGPRAEPVERDCRRRARGRGRRERAGSAGRDPVISRTSALF